MLWPWYIFSIQMRPDLSSHTTRSYIFSSCNRSRFLCVDHHLESPQLWNQSQGGKKTKQNKKTGSCGTSDALRGVMWSSASHSSSSANTITNFSQHPALHLKVFYCCCCRHVPQSILWLYLDCRSPILYWELFQNTVCAVVQYMYCMEKAK